MDDSCFDFFRTDCYNRQNKGGAFVLLHEFDPNKDAVINPEMLVNKIEDFPDVTVSCFSKKLFNNVLSFFDPKQITEVHSAV